MDQAQVKANVNYSQARKQSDGSYKLYYRGTRNLIAGLASYGSARAAKLSYELMLMETV